MAIAGRGAEAPASPPTVLVPACEVRGGQIIRTSTGLVANVLCSDVEVQSSASASFTMWHIEYYAAGYPTGRMLVAPDELVEVFV